MIQSVLKLTGNIATAISTAKYERKSSINIDIQDVKCILFYYFQKVYSIRTKLGVHVKLTVYNNSTYQKLSKTRHGRRYEEDPTIIFENIFNVFSKAVVVLKMTNKIYK